MCAVRLLARRGNTVAPLRGPVLLPLLPETDRINARGTVHREHAIEVIDLVLQQLGEVPFGLKFVRGPCQVPIAYRDVVRALDPDSQVRERETIIPNEKISISDVHDLRVDHGPPALPFHVHEADRRADLRRGNAARASVPLTPVAQRVA